MNRILVADIVSILQPDDSMCECDSARNEVECELHDGDTHASIVFYCVLEDEIVT